jgi:histidinol-phosphate aminotransferase
MTVTRRDLLAASALMLAGPGAALRASAKDVPAGTAPLVLCWNENPYVPSPAARRAVSEAIPHGCRYPSDAEQDDLLGVIARLEGLDSDHLVTGTGSGELLRALGLLYGQGGGEIIAAKPTYTELTEYAQSRGAAIRFVPVDERLRHDLRAMHAAVSAHTRAVYLCNPNNPTGTALPAADIRSFVASLPEPVLTIVDEAYMDFASGSGVETVTDLVKSGRRVVVLRTFSKIHGMAGLRFGYAVARPDIAKDLAAARMTTGNIFAVRAARASIDDQAFRADCRRRILASRVRITSELTALKLRYAEPNGNFVFFDTGMPLKHFTDLMRERNILVGRLFPPYDTWCRITIGTEPEVAVFLKELRAIKSA